MVQMVFEGRVQSGQTDLDFGITDLMLVEGADGPMLYASSGQLGGLTAYDVDAPGQASLMDFTYFDGAWADGVLRNLALVEIDGTAALAVAASGEHQLRLYDLQADGSIGQESLFNGVNANNDQVLDVQQWGSDMLLMADSGTGEIQGYQMGAGGNLTQQITLADGGNTYVAGSIALETVQVGSAEFVISVSQDERGISAFFVGNDKLFNTDNQGVNEGLGIMTPTDSALIEKDGRAFIIVASAPSDSQGQSGALTVLELAGDGSLVPVEHLNDTLNTRFGKVQSLEVVEHDGRTYVIAGGGDDGLSLFTMLPSGRLQLLDTMDASETTGFENVTAMAAHAENDVLRIYAATEAEAGFADISIDLSYQGSTLIASNQGGSVTGTLLDDIIIGGAGADVLNGGQGDDILEDGHGTDTLSGGDGADTYVLRADGLTDRIIDFQPGQDRIDLSDWPMLYDPTQIEYTATGYGAIITWRSETLEIFTRSGQTLSWGEVQAAILATADRAPDWDAIFGNDAAQDVDGTALDDVFVTGKGADTVTGAAGNDFIDGGDDADHLYGDNGNDTLLGGFGGDRQMGGIGNDSLSGMGDNDTLWGEEGADTLVGGSGDDVLWGGDSNDILLGGAGFDTMDAGDGSDLYYVDAGDTLNDSGTVGYDRVQVLSPNGQYINMTGWSGVERVNGNAGNDRLDASMLGDDMLLFGDGGHDTILGGTGNDTILGGTGNDTILGGFGDDSLVGGSGDDLMQGSTGNDTFNGGAGDDTIFVGDSGDVVSDAGAGYDRVLINDPGGLAIQVGGWAGVERIVGFTGNDTIDATGSNSDLVMSGANGHDEIIGGAGNDTVYAGNGNDMTLGGTGDDALIAGNGNDTLDGQAGNDFLAGGFGADVFVFRDGYGQEVVSDFVIGTDHVDVSNWSGVSNIGDLEINVEDGNTVISTGGADALILSGVTGTLSADDFVF